MSNTVTSPRAPSSRSVVEREAHRIVTRHATLTDEVDALINEVLRDEAMQGQWALHSDPIFDDESLEGSVKIDRVRLADMVKAKATENAEAYPLTCDAKTNAVQQRVQAALRRTNESINQRRANIKTAA